VTALLDGEACIGGTARLEAVTVGDAGGHFSNLQARGHR
jgi:hypothetical protein